MSKLSKSVILIISIVLVLAIVLIPSSAKASSETAGNNVTLITQINTNTSKANTNTNTNSNVTNNTTAKGKIPQTGIGNNVGLIVLAGILSISAVYAYKKIREYDK